MTTLFVNDRKVGDGRIDKTEPVRFSANETFDLSMDSASAVSTEYQPPFHYAGTLKKVEMDVAPARLSAGDREKLRALAVMARVGIEQLMRASRIPVTVRVVVLLVGAPVCAQQPAPSPTEDVTALAKKTQNPVGDVTSVVTTIRRCLRISRCWPASIVRLNRPEAAREDRVDSICLAQRPVRPVLKCHFTERVVKRSLPVSRMRS